MLVDSIDFKDNDSQEKEVSVLWRGKLRFKKWRAKVPVSKEWLNACHDYIFKKLTRGELVTLYAYTTQLFYVINDFVAGGKLYRQEIHRIDVEKTGPEEWHKVALFALQALPEVKPFDARHRKAKTELQAKQVYKEFLAFLRTKPKGWQTARIQKEIDDTFVSTYCIFVHQARIFGIRTLAQFRKEMLSFTSGQWGRMLTQFVKDMKTIFENAPPLQETMQLYRGVKTRRKRRGFVSTTLAKSVAKDFIDQEKKCCVVEMVAEKGRHALPIFLLSRYKKELEVLLFEK